MEKKKFFPKNNNNNICKYFLENSCNKPKGQCKFFHGFGSLLHFKTIFTKKGNINNLLKMDDNKYITSDQLSFTVRFIQDNGISDTSLDKKGIKIGKMVFSSNKVIFSLKMEGK